MKKIVAAASAASLFCAIFAAQASAEQGVMSRPIQAASLHEGQLDMVSYWVPLADGAFEVTATFIARDPGTEPMRIMMALADGEGTTFAMPGHRSALYSFARRQDVVEVSVEVRPNEMVEQRFPPNQVVASVYQSR
jgi:hypothetical protein